MRIWLVRHGESLGNIQENAWSKIPDHSIPLTEFGADQAKHAGERIKGYYDLHAPDKKLNVLFSPYLRTWQTKESLVTGLGMDKVANVDARKGAGWEDDRLREQDFGMFSPIFDEAEQQKHYPMEYAHYKRWKDDKGRYYAKAPLGESRADVCLRVGSAIDSIMRDAKGGQEDFLVVTHGVTMRAFEKRFMHRDVEWFENEPNPKNCDVMLIEGDDKKGYTISKMYSGLKRGESLPKDHKTAPLGGWENLKKYGLEPAVQRS